MKISKLRTETVPNSQFFYSHQRQLADSILHAVDVYTQERLIEQLRCLNRACTYLSTQSESNG